MEERRQVKRNTGESHTTQINDDQSELDFCRKAGYMKSKKKTEEKQHVRAEKNYGAMHTM